MEVRVQSFPVAHDNLSGSRVAAIGPRDPPQKPIRRDMMHVLFRPAGR
jgi:hypothetical protein